MPIVSRRHLELVLAEYVDHFNGIDSTHPWINRRQIALRGYRRQPADGLVAVIGSAD
jgi:hypothetical protein